MDHGRTPATSYLGDARRRYDAMTSATFCYWFFIMSHETANSMLREKETDSSVCCDLWRCLARRRKGPTARTPKQHHGYHGLRATLASNPSVGALVAPISAGSLHFQHAITASTSALSSLYRHAVITPPKHARNVGRNLGIPRKLCTRRTHRRLCAWTFRGCTR